MSQDDKTHSSVVLSKGTMVAHYRIVEKIGAGGMGEIYLADDTKLHRQVALKFLGYRLDSDNVAKARFIREAQAVASLDHPNIVAIYEVSEFKGRPFFAMQFVDGRQLSEVIKGKELPLTEIIELALQIVEGLQAAHKKGIVHRDVKPSNILIDSEGRARVADFGLAKVSGEEKLSQTGSTMGTYGYMSPEQAQGKEVDQRSDIFSFGIVLYEMITTKRPFKGEDDAAVLHAITHDEPEPLSRYKSGVSQPLQAIIDKVLQKNPSLRYQTAGDLLADLRRLQSEHVPQRNRKRMAAIAATLVLIIGAGGYYVYSNFFAGEAAIEEIPSLAIMYFENVADPEDKDKTAQMITSLLITDLSESEYMRVVSRQRLYDILKLLGKENLKVVPKGAVSDVAKRAKAKWILTGEVMQTKPTLIVIAEIIEAKGGKILASQKVSGAANEDFFTVVDKLSAEVRKDLSLPGGAMDELDKPVADVTTHSPEAYRYYLEGLDYYDKVYYIEAKKSLKRCLEYDSTFAMAYYWLAKITSFSNLKEEKEIIAQAVKYSPKASQKEKYYIRSLEAASSKNDIQMLEELQKLVSRYPEEKEAHHRLGEYYYVERRFDKAIHYFNKVIEIDPLYGLAYNQLAYCYDNIGDFEKSIWAINKYISLAPHEANPYDSRGELYAWNGKIDLAVESFKKALEIGPEFYWSAINLGHMYLFKRDYKNARRCYQQLFSIGENETRADGRAYLALIPLYQGKFDEALEILDQGLVADGLEQVEYRAPFFKHSLKRGIYLKRKSFDMALKESEIIMQISQESKPNDPVYGRNTYAICLARSGDIAQAEKVAQALRKDIEQEDTTLMGFYWHAMGHIERAKGNIDVALANFQKVEKKWPEDFESRYELANILLEAGKLGEAVEQFERLLKRYDNSRANASIYAVKMHYLLGLAYEKSGWKQKSIEQYQKFLEIWKNADPGIEEVADAQQRLAKLKSEK